jgi:hypothetical protein
MSGMISIEKAIGYVVEANIDNIKNPHTLNARIQERAAKAEKFLSLLPNKDEFKARRVIESRISDILRKK